MKNKEKYQDKNILVLGLAKSGFATAKLLHTLGASVIVNDRKALDGNEMEQELHGLGVELIGGGHPLSLLDKNLDMIVKNPGIPYSNQLLMKAAEMQIPIITEVEIAYEITESPIIGITGSNGKTTTTTLIQEMINKDHDHALLAGNIGNVACEVAQSSNENEVIVMELSSFQLMGIQNFCPKIAVILNLFDAHLDFHGSKAEYAKAKSNILKNQSENNFAVLNYDDEYVMDMGNHSNAKKVYFSASGNSEKGAYIKDGSVFFYEEEIMPVTDIVLPGKHNLENILAAIAATKLYGVSNQAIISVLKQFSGVKHRLQFVESIKGREFYNDSKATNILATEKAIYAFQRPIILLAGGLDRGNSFDALIPALQQVKAVVVFGETSTKLEHAAKQAGITSVKRVHNVEEAVPAAYELSEEGDIILLSPACASWDQYKTFEQRGDIFIEQVHRLK